LVKEKKNMFFTRLVISLVEFGLSLFLSVFIVFWSYKSFVRFNTSYDAEAEIYKGNTAVAVLMAALMYAAALIMKESIYPVVSIVTVGLTDHGQGGRGILTLGACAVGHLILGFLLSVGCVELSLKFFELLSREIDEEREIARGNVAVSVIMAAVVVIIAMFMQQGVGALGKSLIPQPTLGALRMLD